MTHSAMVEDRIAKNRELLKTCPVISIGGDEINAVTQEMRSLGRTTAHGSLCLALGIACM